MRFCRPPNMNPEELNRASEEASRQRELCAEQGRLASALRESGLRDVALEVVATVTAELELAIRRSGNAGLSLLPVSNGCGFYLKGEGAGLLITPVVANGNAGVRLLNARVDAAFSRPEAAIEFLMQELCR